MWMCASFKSESSYIHTLTLAERGSVIGLKGSCNWLKDASSSEFRASERPLGHLSFFAPSKCWMAFGDLSDGRHARKHSQGEGERRADEMQGPLCQWRFISRKTRLLPYWEEEEKESEEERERGGKVQSERKRKKERRKQSDWHTNFSLSSFQCVSVWVSVVIHSQTVVWMFRPWGNYSVSQFAANFFFLVGQIRQSTVCVCVCDLALYFVLFWHFSSSTLPVSTDRARRVLRPTGPSTANNECANGCLMQFDHWNKLHLVIKSTSLPLTWGTKRREGKRKMGQRKFVSHSLQG